MNIDYFGKYLKYKTKYFTLKNQIGGNDIPMAPPIDPPIAPPKSPQKSSTTCIPINDNDPIKTKEAIDAYFKKQCAEKKTQGPEKKTQGPCYSVKTSYETISAKKEEVPSSEKSAEQVISAEQKAFASSILGAKLKSTDSRSIEERLAEQKAAKLAEQTAAKLPILKKVPLPRN